MFQAESFRPKEVREKLRRICVQNGIAEGEGGFVLDYFLCRKFIQEIFSNLPLWIIDHMIADLIFEGILLSRRNASNQNFYNIVIPNDKWMNEC